MKHLLFFAISLSALLTHGQTPLWMRYAAISPDGQKIAFSYQGDIYVVPAAGGVAMPVTMHEAYDIAPVWSHDGKKLAFASDRHGNLDVFVVSSSGGVAERLTYYSSPDMPSDFSQNDQEVIFTSSRMDRASNQQFPSGALPELYTVSVNGGQERQVLTIPALWARYNSKFDMLVYQDQKGYEDDFRKHHTSSVTRDIWTYDFTNKTYKQVSSYSGEDLNPVFSADDKAVFYASEEYGTMNIVKLDLSSGRTTGITKHTDHPVRYISISKSNKLCYTWNGEIYTVTEGANPEKVSITIYTDGRYNPEHIVPVSGLTDMDISPNGKEIAFISRGEVFVSSVAEGTTRRITNTPEQERNIDFSPDGRSLLYSSERNGSWNIYQTTLQKKEEEYFFLSTLLKEEALLDGPEETFQASYSPDGKEIAYLEERTTLKVYNIQNKQSRLILAGDKNYSYADGDQHYDWSPDGKYFLVSYLPGAQWIDQIGLVSSDGKGEIKNLSESGYGAYGASWMMEGKMMMYFSARDGKKNHASWGGELDVYGMFFTQEAYDEFMMNEEEFAIYSEAKKKKEEEEKKKKDEEKEKDKDKNKKNTDKEADKKPEIKPIKIELDNLKDRRRRLTIHSADMASAWVSNDGSKLFYLAEFEKGFDLWQTNLRTRETKILAKLGSDGGGLVADKEGKNLYVVNGNGITRVDVEKGETKPVPIKGEIVLNENAERAYLFEHIWRQVKKKFYVADLHKVKWDFYKSEYARFLPHINNNYDFADCMGEMLGELNASHTGAFYNQDNPMGDQTARLGIFFDQDYSGKGLRIQEIMPKSPVLKSGTKIKPGIVLEKIDGNEITPAVSYYKFLNRKAGQNTLLSLYNPANGERWEETVKPMNGMQEGELRYQRWIENCRHIVDSLSNGKIGYVHVRGMDDHSYRVVYDETLGKHAFKDALIVDTRFNGGGWLHEDLATFLSGKEYITIMPRGQNLGKEAQFKWIKPSVVVMNESNYSDAHLFPYAYRAQGIGKLVGMPVPGTGTAVWWELLQNGVVFGIPQVGMVDTEGDLLENKQLEPDVKVANEPGVVITGRDQQLEKAVEVLLKK